MTQQNDGPEAALLLRLAEAKNLLRVVRKPQDIDPSGGLSKGAVPLNDLTGQPNSTTGSLRSTSAFMLCNQAVDTLVEIARSLSKVDDLRKEPRGAAAALSDITDLRVQDTPAFSVIPETVDGQPGHVSIRFGDVAKQLNETMQRDLRDRLIRMFGAVAPVAVLYSERCR